METAITSASGAQPRANSIFPRPARFLLYGLIGVLYAGGLVLSYQLLEPSPPEALPAALLPLIPTVLGVLILRSQPGHIVGYLFLIMAAAIMLQVMATGTYELSQLLAIPFYPLVESITLILAATLYVPAIVIPLFLVPLYFPEGKLLSPRWRLLVALILLQIIWPFIAAAVRPWPSPYMDLATTRIWNGIPGSEATVDALTQLSAIFWLPVPLLVFLGMFLRFRRSSGPERRQVQLPIFTIAGVILLALVVWLTPLTDLDQRFNYLITWFLVMLIPVSFGAAILSRGLWDIEIIVSRTLVYGGLSAAIVAIYAAIVAISGILFTRQANAYGGLIAAVIIAVLFQPLRDRLQRRVNHLVYGRRDDPVGMLTDLARRLETADGPEHIFPMLVESVAGALRLPFVAIALPQDGPGQSQDQPAQWEIVATAGEPMGQVRTIPLRYQNQEIGRLQVAPRGPGARFSPEDDRLLATIAQLSATVVHAAQQTSELQRSRRLLITSREEERRRLRRDLHDGLGPVLAAVALQADTAHDLAESDPAETKAILDSIRQQAQTAVADIRHLVHGLRPPRLDELGLVAALQQSARAYRHKLDIQIVADELPPLPAAVEVAALRIAQEALNNVVKHARAEACSVTVHANQGLHLAIEDDGVGIAPENIPGVGFNSMRERAAELGGLCSIEERPSGGTRVAALLPLPSQKAR
jgi:signal transduction histidine kinase